MAAPVIRMVREGADFSMAIGTSLIDAIDGAINL
jgi:hypothetical protein